MEVPVINRIGEFDGAISCSLTDPSFLSRGFSIPGIEKIPQAYSFWKWGALILAIIATFSSLFNRIKFFIIRHGYPVSEPLLRQSEYEVSTDDDDDVSSSYSSDDDGGSEDGDHDTESSVENSGDDFDDYRVAGVGSDRLDDEKWQNGKFKLRRRRSFVGDRFSWSDFACGKSVVKLWDGLGLGIDLNNSSGSVLSIYDLNRDQKLTTIFGGKYQIPAVSAPSPTVIFSAGVESSPNIAMKVWDPRVGFKIPAILAEWRPVRGKVVGINSSGVEKVFVRDDVSGELTVRDMRNVNSPLENMTDSDEDTWWDADAVMVSKECGDDVSAVYNRDSMRSRCRGSVLHHLF